MTVEFGLIDTGDLGLPLPQLADKIHEILGNFSYDFSRPPDFRGLFNFIATNFADCDDMRMVQRGLDLLGLIASYKLGVYCADIFTRATPMVVRLLASPNVDYLKSAIDYFRKITRAIGPRLVIERFIAPNADDPTIQRGLVVTAHQIIVDSPDFKFKESDFGEWATILTRVAGSGRLAHAISQCNTGVDMSPADDRPPTVPAVLNLPRDPAKRASVRPPLPDSNRSRSARPGIPRRMDLRQDSVMYQMSSRQQQVREFIDEPFGEGEKVSNFVAQMNKAVADPDWEARSAGYNLARRLIKYASDSVSDDDTHNLITAVLGDITNSRAALALSAIGALEEAFAGKAAVMEFELARIIPVVLKLNQKTPQFFQAALGHCGDIMIANMPPKRFLSVLVSSAATKSAKVEAAEAKYCRDSLMKCVSQGEKLFPKNSDDLIELIRLIQTLQSGSVSETRKAAKEAAKQLASIYGESFYPVVNRALDGRAAAEFMNGV